MIRKRASEAEVVAAIANDCGYNAAEITLLNAALQRVDTIRRRTPL